MSLIEIVPLIGICISVLFSIISLLLPTKPKTISTVSSKNQNVLIEDTSPLAVKETLLLERIDQELDQAKKEKEKEKKSQQEVIQLLLAHSGIS